MSRPPAPTVFPAAPVHAHMGPAGLALAIIPTGKWVPDAVLPAVEVNYVQGHEVMVGSCLSAVALIEAVALAAGLDVVAVR